MARSDVSNSDDVIDSRDVIARVDELELDRRDLADAVADAQEEFDAQPGEKTESALAIAAAELETWDSDYADKLKALQALASEASYYAEDWRHGATLVRNSYFVEYCQELVQDIGDLPNGIPSYIKIDWEKTASNIQQDYAAVDFDGVTYWVR